MRDEGFYQIMNEEDRTVIVRKTVKYSVIALEGALSPKNMMDILQIQRNVELFKRYNLNH